MNILVTALERSNFATCFAGKGVTNVLDGTPTKVIFAVLEL